MIPHDVDSVAQRDALGHVDVPAESLQPFELLSHEVRTPLTVLLAGTEVLEQRFQDDELATVVAAMRRAARRIDRVVDGLSTAFDDSGTRSLGRLSQIVDLVVDELPRTDRVRVNVRIEPAAANHHLPMDDVSTILRELVENACKFSPAGGAVALCAEVIDERLVVTVRDQGPGIDESACESAFAPFHQLDMRSVREYDGLGMGLYTARRRARELGGDVTLADGDGGAVRFSLPLRHDCTT